MNNSFFYWKIYITFSFLPDEKPSVAEMPMRLNKLLWIFMTQEHTLPQKHSSSKTEKFATHFHANWLFEDNTLCLLLCCRHFLNKKVVQSNTKVRELSPNWQVGLARLAMVSFQTQNCVQYMKMKENALLQYPCRVYVPTCFP